MKTGWVFLLSGIFIIAIGLAWIITGWPSGVPVMPGTGPGPAPDTVPHETVPVPLPETNTVAPTPQSTPKISSDAIKLHFLDLAFGDNNAYLERWDATAKNGRISLSVTANNDADIQLLENAAREFNSVSQTNQVSGSIRRDSTGDITIKFIPENGLGGIAINSSVNAPLRELTVNGVTAARIIPGTIYINASLKGDVRNHTLIRSLFYELGIVGHTDTYPDSVFYRGDNTNTNLTYTDLKAIEIMYGNLLAPGMTVNDVKGIVFVR